MATFVLRNQKSGHATLLFNTSNTNVQITDLATPNTSVETVTSAPITKLIWNGDWVVARGGATIATLSGEGHWDLAQYNAVLNMTPAANCSFTAGSTAGVLIVEFAKVSTYANNEYLTAN